VRRELELRFACSCELAKKAVPPPFFLKIPQTPSTFQGACDSALRRMRFIIMQVSSKF